MTRVAFNVQQLAEASGMSADKIYALIRSKQLRARKVGVRWLIPADSVQDFLAEGQHARTAIN